MGRDTPGSVVLGGIRMQTKQVMGTSQDAGQDAELLHGPCFSSCLSPFLGFPDDGQ